MFQNYFITALRNMARHKLYSFINIAGLAIGLACAVLIALFLRDELSYDKWIPGSENLWRVEVTYHVPGRSDPVVTAQTSMPLPLAMRDQLPDVRSATRLAREKMSLTSGDRQFLEKVAVVDPNFLQVVPLPLAEGDSRTVLAQPGNIVISQSAARKFFGDTDPIGKILTTLRGGCGSNAICGGTTVALRVAGIMRDLPSNTQFDFDYLVPNNSLADRMDQDSKKDWLSNSNTFGYVTLAPGADPAGVVAKLKPILDRSIDISRFGNLKIHGSQILEPRLTRFRDVHLAADAMGDMKPPGSWTILYGMGAVGLLILLVACFNFINLATARATMRAREISLRKCVGARRGQLIVQFLGEAVLMSLIALVVALALVEMLLTPYSAFMGRPLQFHYIGDWQLSLGIIGIGILAGLLSGVFPALVLSSIRPAATLRANSSGRSGSGRLRTALVVLQFAVSIGLGIGALVVFQQIQFASKIDLGFDRNNIVIVGTPAQMTENGIQNFVQALERGPDILQVTRTSFVPFNNNVSVFFVQRPGDAQFLSPNHISVSQDYFHLFSIKILAGRALQNNREEDNYYEDNNGDEGKNEGHNFMVNAALAHALGYSPADIIGKIFLVGKSHVRVVGVVADTLSEGVRSAVMQTAYVHRESNLQGIAIRIAPGHTPEAMDYIEHTWRSVVHGAVLSPTFLADDYGRLYQGDERQDQVFGIFVALAIVIACLGLFGLAAFTAGRRTKEIGIRKVFGARTRDVMLLLLWQFSIPVLLANLIAWPLAWYYLTGWLQGFAYRISLNPLYFAAVGLIALVIAWATVFIHAARVARANPIFALRYE